MSAIAWAVWCQREWPGLSAAECSTVLWSCTSFPLGTQDDVEAEFIAVRDASGGDFLRALELADERQSATQAA